MNLLFLRGFNNYHKRTILKFSTLNEYIARSASSLNYASVNFNPNDGVVTELVIGGATQKDSNGTSWLDFETGGCPDYLVCYQHNTESNTDEIVSRWFVLEAERTRKGQYRLALKRDVIADNEDWLKGADVFIEKGIIKSESSPFLFNNESMTYNQIKKKEIPLYDSTGVPWIVGYVAKNYTPENDTAKTITGTAINQQANDDAEDVEDIFGSLTDDNIAQGISLNTITNINLLYKLRCDSTILDLGKLHFFCGRIKIPMSPNYSDQSIDTNYDLYYDRKAANHIETIRDVAGDGLGDYYNDPSFACDGDDEEVGDVDGSAGHTPNDVGPLPSAYAAATPGRTRQNIPINIKTLSSLLAIKTVVGVTVPNAVFTYAKSSLTTYNYDTNGLQYYLNLNGKSVKRTVGGVDHFYTLRVTVNYTQDNYLQLDDGYFPANVWNDINTALKQAVESQTGDWDWTKWYGITYCADSANIQVEFIQTAATVNVQCTMPKKADRYGCNDQLFDIFCIPFGTMLIGDYASGYGGLHRVMTRKDAALAIARAFAQELGTNLYDLQIMPFCPIKEIRDAYIVEPLSGKNTNGAPSRSGELYYSARNQQSTTDFLVCDSTEVDQRINWFRISDANDATVVYNFVFWAYESHGRIDIPVSAKHNCYCQYDLTSDFPESVMKKISNETEFIRLCSPNYNGLFEYSPAKNNDFPYHLQRISWIENGVSTNQIQYVTDIINADYTYRPGNPYIHLNPKFKGEDEGGFYGKDFHDARGLICGGDFSLGYIVDAFRNYQIQNANFQNIFDRQIQNLDTMNALQTEQTRFTSTMGALGLSMGGGVTGAIAGAKATGSPYGAIAGAAVGTAGGIVGGIVGANLNMEWLARQQQETRAYTKDMYNYTLGNIKALPYSISKTDCLTENSRLVPFIEVYECTNTEVMNLVNVLKYDGMTVMSISQLSNYMFDSNNPIEEMAVMAHDKRCYFVKGRLIMDQYTELADDFHIVDEIYKELSKGVYLAEA